MLSWSRWCQGQHRCDGRPASMCCVWGLRRPASMMCMGASCIDVCLGPWQDSIDVLSVGPQKAGIDVLVRGRGRPASMCLSGAGQRQRACLGLWKAVVTWSGLERQGWLLIDCWCHSSSRCWRVHLWRAPTAVGRASQVVVPCKGSLLGPSVNRCSRETSHSQV